MDGIQKYQRLGGYDKNTMRGRIREIFKYFKRNSHMYENTMKPIVIYA